NAGSVVDLRGRDGGARVQVTDHAVDLGVDQLGGGSRALLGVGGIVFSQQFELGILAIDLQTGSVELVDGHAGTVFVVFAQVGNGTAGGPHVTDLDNHAFRSSGGGGSGRRSGFFFFAASGQNDGRRNHGQFHLQLHM